VMITGVSRRPVGMCLITVAVLMGRQHLLEVHVQGSQHDGLLASNSKMPTAMSCFSAVLAEIQTETLRLAPPLAQEGKLTDVGPD
jgi:hypothetical protein